MAKALDFVRQIRKTPIVVNDARFFYANRCIMPYINEGIRMVGEGVAPALIENAAELLGFPVGPAATDRRDLDRPRASRSPRPPRRRWATPIPTATSTTVLFWLAEQGRLGRKAKRRVLRL